MVLTQIINWVYTDILTVIYHQISIFGNNTKYRLTVFSVVDMGSIWIAEHLVTIVLFISSEKWASRQKYLPYTRSCQQSLLN